MDLELKDKAMLITGTSTGIGRQLAKTLAAKGVRIAMLARENIPLGCFGEPQDMAYAVAFLASPKARYITGELLSIDGGMRRYAF